MPGWDCYVGIPTALWQFFRDICCRHAGLHADTRIKESKLAWPFCRWGKRTEGFGEWHLALFSA